MIGCRPPLNASPPMKDGDDFRKVTPPRHAIMLASGNYFNLDDPENSRIDLFDIAHALSHICRFTGHVTGFYSVAEHSVLCSHLVPRKHAMAALMHDAAEAVLGDMASPLKAMMPEYRALESRVEATIMPRFGISLPMNPWIKHADQLMLAAEFTQAMNNPDWWLEHMHPVQQPKLLFWSPDDARSAFLARHEEVRSYA